MHELLWYHHDDVNIIMRMWTTSSWEPLWCCVMVRMCYRFGIFSIRHVHFSFPILPCLSNESNAGHPHPPLRSHLHRANRGGRGLPQRGGGGLGALLPHRGHHLAVPALGGEHRHGARGGGGGVVGVVTLNRHHSPKTRKKGEKKRTTHGLDLHCLGLVATLVEK